MAVDRQLLGAAQITPFEQVDIYNITNGNRFSTYALPAAPDTGAICIDGAAARLAGPDDLIIICCCGQLDDEQIDTHRAIVIHVDASNRITEARRICVPEVRQSI